MCKMLDIYFSLCSMLCFLYFIRIRLSPTTLGHWVQAAREGKMVPAQRADEKELDLVRLRNENRRLRMECDILKKAAAYFAKGTL